MKIAARGRVEPFYVMEAMREADAYAREGMDIIHLSVGQPGADAPLKVRQKAAELVLKGTANLGYTDAFGIAPLREAIAKFYHTRHGITISPARIAITVGSSAATFLSLLCAFEQGDSVAIATPAYPAYPNMLQGLGLKPLFMRTHADTNYQPTIAMIKALPQKPDGLIVASPSNPTGTVIHADELKALAEYCDAEGIRLISDEIYHGITYGDARINSAAAYSKNAIVINSFSKYFLMPGFRLGWAVLPEDMLRPYECLLQNFFISAPALSQYAAAEIFDCLDELDAVVAGYARNRALLMDALPNLGFDILCPPEGAFYIYANVSRITNDSAAFCKKLLKETGVVAVPGLDFDREEGLRHMRFSFCGQEPRIAEAIARMQDWMSRIK